MEVELLYSAAFLSQDKHFYMEQQEREAISNHKQPSVCCTRVLSTCRKCSGVCQLKVFEKRLERSGFTPTYMPDVCVYIVCTKNFAYFQVSHTNFLSPDWQQASVAVLTLRWEVLALPCLFVWKPAFQGWFLASKMLKTNKKDLHQVKCIWLLRFSSARGEVWAIAQMSKFSGKKGDSPHVEKEEQSQQISRLWKTET